MALPRHFVELVSCGVITCAFRSRKKLSPEVCKICSLGSNEDGQCYCYLEEKLFWASNRTSCISGPCPPFTRSFGSPTSLPLFSQVSSPCLPKIYNLGRGIYKTSRLSLIILRTRLMKILLLKVDITQSVYVVRMSILNSIVGSSLPVNKRTNV